MNLLVSGGFCSLNFLQTHAHELLLCMTTARSGAPCECVSRSCSKQGVSTATPGPMDKDYVPLLTCVCSTFQNCAYMGMLSQLYRAQRTIPSVLPKDGSKARSSPSCLQDVARRCLMIRRDQNDFHQQQVAADHCDFRPPLVAS